MPLIGPPLRARVDIPNLLRGGLGRAPDDPAVVSDGLRYSWRDMERATDALARNFLGLGLAPGERVASLMPNRAVLLVHYLASMKAGLVSVPLNYRYTVPEIDHALAVSGASVLLADRERLDELAKSSRIRDLRSGLILHEAEPGRGPNLLDLIASTPANTELPIPKSADPAFIFFTSGSTRPAKGVTHTYETLGWMFAAYAASLEIAPGDVVLPGGSLSHVASFGYCFGALTAGARVVIAESIEGPRLLRLLRERRPTVFWTSR